MKKSTLLFALLMLSFTSFASGFRLMAAYGQDN